MSFLKIAEEYMSGLDEWTVSSLGIPATAQQTAHDTSLGPVFGMLQRTLYPVGMSK